MGSGSTGLDRPGRARLGLLGDTHIPEAGPELPQELLAAFAGCDQILHCGDLHTITVIDALEHIAPTLACRGNGDGPAPRGRRPGVPQDPRVTDDLVIDIGGLRIGMTHDLSHVEETTAARAAELVAARFAGPVDLAVSGHTHVPLLWGLEDGTTLVNPGSPTMPYGYLGILGTVALVEIEEAGFQVSVVDLRTGQVQLAHTGPGPSPLRRGARPAGGR